MKGISIFLIEDSLLFGSALNTVLRRAGFLVTTYTSKSVPIKRKAKSAVVLLDVATFSGIENDIEALVKEWSTCAPVLLLGREDRVEQILAGLRAGAAGFVKQAVSPRHLQRAITIVAAGGTWCERTVFQKVMQYLPRLSYAAQPRLTKREAEVLKYLVRGQTNREIAQNLGLTEQAIKIHVSNLLRKTGTSNRNGLSVYAIRQGLAEA